MTSTNRGVDRKCRLDLDGLNNPRIEDFLQKFPLNILDYENKALLRGEPVSVETYKSLALHELNNTVHSINYSQIPPPFLPTFSSTQFCTGRVNSFKSNWFELLKGLENDPDYDLMVDILNSEVKLERFFSAPLESEIQIGEDLVKWTRCSQGKLLPLKKVNDDWQLCHDLSVRRKQIHYQFELDLIISELVQAGCVHVCGEVDRVDKSFFRLISPLHVVLESRMDAKSGKFKTRIRSTVDCKAFNKAFLPPSFYLLTGNELQKALQNAETASSYDLRKSFYNFLPCPDINSFTGFVWRNFLCFYHNSAFGLSISPYLNNITTDFALKIFFNTLKRSSKLKPFLNSLSVVYVDDFLLCSKFKNPTNKILNQDRVFIHLMASLGFTINNVKSDCVAQKKFKYLGLHFNINRKQDQIFTQPTETQITNLKLNLAQLLSAGLFRSLDELENSDWAKNDENRKRFFGSTLNHNTLEKVTGSLNWLEGFNTFEVDAFLIKRGSYFPYLLSCLNFQNALKVQIWNLFIEKPFEKIFNPSNFSKLEFFFTDRVELLEAVKNLAPYTARNFTQVNFILNDPRTQDKITEWKRDDTKFFNDLRLEMIKKRSKFQAVNFRFEKYEREPESHGGFVISQSNLTKIFLELKTPSRKVTHFFQPSQAQETKFCIGINSKWPLSYQLDNKWPKLDSNTTFLINQMPVNSAFFEFQRKNPLSLLVIFSCKKQLRVMCREILNSSKFHIFRISADKIQTVKKSNLAYFHALLIDPK